MKRILAIVSGVLCAVPSANKLVAQGTQLPPGLQSDSVWERAEAFGKLKKASPTFAGAGARSALVTLLERENALLVASERPGERSVGERYGEGYSEYYAEVLGACAKFCPRSQPRAVRALLGGAYNTDSPLAVDLARRHGSVVIAVMMENLQRTDWNRAEYLQMMALAARESRELTPKQRALTRQTALLHSGSNDAGSRVAVVSMLAEVGTSEDLPLLDRLANQDPYHYRTAGRDIYPVREAARRALRRVRPSPP